MTGAKGIRAGLLAIAVLALAPAAAQAIPPDTEITSGPVQDSTIPGPTATWTFQAVPAMVGDKFHCNLDGVVTDCTSGTFTTPALSAGPHLFVVNAQNAGLESDLTPAIRNFTVSPPPPPPPPPAIVPSPPLPGTVALAPSAGVTLSGRARGTAVVKLVIRVSCPASATGGCAGDLLAYTGRTGKSGKAKIAAADSPFTEAPFAAPAGGTQDATLKVPRSVLTSFFEKGDKPTQAQFQVAAVPSGVTPDVRQLGGYPTVKVTYKATTGKSGKPSNPR